MTKLLREYRPMNQVLEFGVSAGDNGTLKYYKHPNISFRGHNTFMRQNAEQGGFADHYVELPVININQIFEEYVKDGLDVLDVDAEGMDYDLLKALDTNRYKVKIICAENGENGDVIREMLALKGYVHYMSTLENTIYVLQEVIKDL